MTLNNHTTNREAQSYAMRLHHQKRIENTAQLFRIYSWPGTFDRDDNCISIVKARSHPQHPISICSIIHCLNCVLDQIRNHLLQLSLVTRNRQRYDASSVRVVTRCSANSPREDFSTSSAISLTSIACRS